MLIATSIYMLVAVGAIGAISYTVLAESAEPLAFVLRALDHPAAASAVALAAIVALPSVILVMMYGQSRIFFVMSRDGLLRSEEHTSELQSLMRISYAVFCLK